MARYYQSREYNPISQAYNPTTLKYIDEAGQYKQANTDLQTAGLSETQKLLNLQGGYSTTDLAKQTAAKYEPEIAALNEEIATKGSVSGGAAKILALRNRISSDSDVQSVLEDQAYKTKVDAITGQPGFESHIQDFYNPQNGSFKQRRSGEKFNPSQWYNELGPGNTNAEYKPLFDQIKPIISRIYANPVTKEVTDANGNIHTQQVQEGIESETLRKQQVRDTLASYIQQDPSALNKQSRIYAEKLHELQSPGSKYDVNDHLDDITNSFLGDYSTQKEIQKVSADRISKTGSGSNSGSDKPKQVNRLPMEGTPLVDSKKTVFDTDKLIKKNRADISKYNPTSTGGSQPAGFKDAWNKGAIPLTETPSYGSLSSDEQKVYDGIVKNQFQIEDVSKLSDKDKDKLNSDVKVYIENINKDQQANYATGISEYDYPSVGGKKGAEAITQDIFNGDKISDVGATGKFLDRKYYDPESGKNYSGKEFYENIMSKMPKDAPISVVTKYNNKNTFTSLTDKEDFSTAYQISINGKQYVMSGGVQEYDSNDINVVPYNIKINQLSRIKYKPEKEGEIEFTLPTGGIKKVNVRVSDNKWSMKLPTGSPWDNSEKLIEGNSEEEFMSNYNDYILNKTSSTSSSGKAQVGARQ